MAIERRTSIWALLFRRKSEETNGHFYEATRKWLIVAALVLIIGGAAMYYSRGYEFIPGDDPSVALMAGRYISETHTTTFLNPLEGRHADPLYVSVLPQELSLHMLLGELYMIFQTDNILRLTNIFMVLLFCLGGVTLYFLFFEVTRHAVGSLLGVALAVTSYYYGYTFWSGHYAQILGILILELLLYALIRYERRKERQWIWAAVVLLVFLLPAHSLTFLVALIVFLAYALIQGYRLFEKRKKRKAFLLVLLFLLSLVVGLVFILRDHDSFYQFSVEDYQSANLRGTALVNFESFLSPLLLLAGCYAIIRRKKLSVVLIWFLTTYLLINSTFLHIPFFPYRFNEFMSVPLAVMWVIGFVWMFKLIRSSFVRIALILAVMALFIPYNIRQQIHIRSCYIVYCPGLNPASLVSQDFHAFQWVASNTHPTSVFIAHKKFGIFLPAVALRSVTFPEKYENIENAPYRAMTAPSVEERWRAAREAGADYILWDAAFTLYPDYDSFQAFRERYSDQKYFQKVYDKEDVRIYRVRSIK